MSQHSQLRGGIDLGGTKIQAVVLDSKHKVLGQARRATPTLGGPRSILDEIAGTLREAAREAGLQTRELSGIGMGSPGAVDGASGTIERAGNLSGFEDPVPAASELAHRLGARVFVGNDVGVALDAEARLGAGREFASFVGLFWGTGIGGGVILDGKRWLGRGAAGEIGHMVVKLDGAPCPCGRRGCLEAYAGRRAMEDRARKLVEHRQRKTKLFHWMEKKGKPRLSSSIWAKGLEKQDELAVELVERAVAALGAGLASAVNLLDVEGVVIGGGLGSRLGEPWSKRIAEAMQPHLFVPARPPRVRVAQLGDLAGAVGAGLLALDAAAVRTA
ncbi:MAG: ROK family protein [Planctomycetes bacterium]|nr:ROK family protein [Planctomycetota bacterium]